MTRATESRLPEALSASDLGEATVSSDGKAALVSYYTSPVCLDRKQTYVLFILDAALRAQVSGIQWQVRLTDVTTPVGVWEYTPDDPGEMTLNVTLKDSSSATLRTLSLTQHVVPPNSELETLIALDNQAHPIAGDPATSREVINDLLPWLHDLAPVSADENLTRLLFAIAYVEALDHGQADRDRLIARLADELNQSRAPGFFQRAGAGAGVCRLRPEILAMTLQSAGSPLIPWEELPADAGARTAALARIQAALAGLSAERHIDIFNLLRFPKANLGMCRTILDALLARYFAGSSYANVLAAPANAQQLLDSFRTGPRPASQAGGSTAYRERVIGRMVSNLWFQVASKPPAVGGGAGASGANVVGPLPTPPALFGVPERVPELTFVVGAYPNDNGFIQSANDYHETYGLNPQTFESLENLVDSLRQGSGHIGRLRIVSHVGLDTRAGADANMNVALFQDDGPGVDKDILLALADSDAAAVRQMLGFGNAITPARPMFNSLVPDILGHLRTTAAAVLSPFGLESAGARPSGNVEQLLFALSDLLATSLVFANPNNGSITWQNTETTFIPFNAGQRTTMTNALNLIREHVESEIVASGSQSAAELQALRSAVLGLSMADLNLTSLGGRSFSRFRTNAAGVTTFRDPMEAVAHALAAMTSRDFRQRLETARGRIDGNSTIDIRGCRVGQDPGFLEAIAKFLGRPGDLPAVTGPEWYQSFPSAAYRPLANEANVDDLWNNGSSFTAGSQTIRHPARMIQDVFNRVATWSGVDIHIDFWGQVTQLDPLAFAAMLWKSDLPPLPISPPRLEGFGTLDFGDTLARIAEVFNVASSLPAAATRNRIAAAHVQLAALQAEIIAIDAIASRAAPSAAEISQSFSRLQAINSQLGLSAVPAAAPSPLQVSHLRTYAERLKKYFQIVVIPNGPASFHQAWLAVEELAAAASPSAADLSQRFGELAAVQTAIGASGIVPESEPAGLDAATLQGYVQPLIEHLNGTADLLTFAQAVHSKTQQSLPQVPAAFRYYFFVGLPLLVDDLNNWCFFTLNTHRNAAIRSFMQAQWQDPLPTPNSVSGATINQPAARQLAMLTEMDNARNELAQFINPYPEYDDHIHEVP